MTKVDYEIDAKLKKLLKNIPSSSGIYMMSDKKGEVIYIGKALNLKNRVRSYFNLASWKERPKLSFMMPKVKEIKTVITHAEKEALILEANLVNKYQPKYNVTLKDDKKFPWLMITYDEDYPRVVPIRDVVGFKNKYPSTKNKFFGPYSDSGAMWEMYKVIKEGFQLRLRRRPLFKDRPCINYYIKLCSGPCQKLISYNGYHKIVKQVEDFLLGKYDLVLMDLKEQMKESSKRLEYEKAAKIRDTIQKIKKVLEKQIVVSGDHTLTQDIFACDYAEGIMILELLLVREGKVIAVESLKIEIPKCTSPDEAFQDGIKQYYSMAQDNNIPGEIVVQFGLSEKEQIEEWLGSRVIARSEATKQSSNDPRKEIASSSLRSPRNDKISTKVKITYPKKGKKLELVKMASQNAKIALQKILVSNIVGIELLQSTSLQELQKELNLKNYPHHIECLDISHLGGTGTVGSMVCFIKGQPEKSMYRKFKLKTVVNEIDDYKAIKEIVTRRYRSTVILSEAKDLLTNNMTQNVRRSGACPEQSEWGSNEPQDDNKYMPDLIIIDGGKGQLNAAREALESVGVDLEKVDLISLAKKREEVFRLNKKTPILLDRKSQALFLLQRIRDEAHRFAITYQREKRKKDLFESTK